MKLFVPTITIFALLVGSTDAALTSITDDGATAPTGALIQNTGNTSNTRVNNGVADPNNGNPRTRIRGQSFTTTSAIDVSAITLQLRGDNPGNAVPSSGSNPMRLRIWDLGTSVAPSAGTSLLDGSAEFPLNMDAGDHFTFNLSPSVSLSAATQYGFSIEFTGSNANDIFPAQLGGFNGGDLLFNGSAITDTEVNSTNTGQDMTFYIQGAVIPEPSSLAMLVIGLLAIANSKKSWI
ncbi:MAG: PEP-CTERM sorting domain-containing protein [Pirellulales bacterium]|nr:PEP-CTERM sorting domain-containing protein [Pirellulales bacterium]